MLEQEELPQPSSLPRCSWFSNPLKYRFVRKFAFPVYSSAGNIFKKKKKKKQ